MADEKTMKKAETVYNAFCEMLDKNGVHYEKRPEKLTLHFIMNGEDIPMDIIGAVDADKQLVSVYSFLPFTFSPEKRVEGAIATCQTNYKLVDGSFDYNFNDGRLLFRCTSNYVDSLLSKDLFAYMIACVCYTVDKYNDKLLMLDKGLLSLEDYIKQL